jgi:hypothetical protein
MMMGWRLLAEDSIGYCRKCGEVTTWRARMNNEDQTLYWVCIEGDCGRGYQW